MEYVNITPHNSFEFGKANQRHKIYYQTFEGLITKIMKLKNLGLTDIEVDLEGYANYCNETKENE